MPAVANLVGTGQDERIRRGFWRAMRLLVLATFPLVAGVAVAGPALLELAYGAAYSDAGPVLLAMLAPLRAAADAAGERGRAVRARAAAVHRRRRARGDRRRHRRWRSC